MPMKIQSRTKKNLVTPAQFAKMKDVSRHTVYNHIDDGKIAVVLVGKEEDHYIDLNKYADHKFIKYVK